MNDEVRLGFVGLGRWGPNHVRVFEALPGCRVTRLADPDPARLREARRLFPNGAISSEPAEVLEDPAIDAVVIASPSVTHAPLAAVALQAGKDVLCEKPLALSASDARRLIELAERGERVLMVSHVFLYNAGIRALRGYVREGRLGHVQYLYATRTNLGPIRTDVNAAWDLASHDLGIFGYLLGQAPHEVSAQGARILSDLQEDVAFLTLRYPDGVLAHAHVSWLDPRKVRQITVVGTRQMAVWDDLDNVAPIRLFDKGVSPPEGAVNFGEFRFLTREGDVLLPRIDLEEPLKVQNRHFLECIRERRRPLTDGRNGLEVVRQLEAVDRSLAAHGAPVAIQPRTQLHAAGRSA
ncbi:MAG: Gfo/Idh/MocA family protein [Gemmatimonadota bacterium]